MPWTFAHPVVVVPLRRARFLDFTALVIGSMTPDLGYYFRSAISGPAHSFVDSFAYDLLPGLALYVLFLALRKPLCFLLPSPHREALLRGCETRPALSLRNFAVIAVSLLLGAWTHIAWDRLTHHASWYVLTTPRLYPLAIAGGMARLSSYAVLEILGSIVGALVLAALYARWLVRRRLTSDGSAGSDTWRYVVFATISIVSLVAGFALTARDEPIAYRYHLVEPFISTFAVDFFIVAIPLLVVVGCAAWLLRGRFHVTEQALRGRKEVVQIGPLVRQNGSHS